MALKVPVTWRDEVEHRRKLAEGVNGLIDGRSNNSGTFTLTENDTTTTVTDGRVGTDSIILWMPTTANAAAEIAVGGMYVSARGDGTFTVTHANNAQTDRDFSYAIIATSSST